MYKDMAFESRKKGQGCLDCFSMDLKAKVGLLLHKAESGRHSLREGEE